VTGPATRRRGRRAAVRVPRPPATPARLRRRPGVGPLWAIVLVVLTLAGILLGRLAQWQLGPEEDAPVPPEQTRELTEPAVRGAILAADGTPLAVSAPATVVTVDPAVLITAEDEGADLLARVARHLGLPEEEVWGRTRVCGTEGAPPVPSCFSGSPQEPVVVAEGVDPAVALGLLERPEEFPGVDVTTRPVRSHPSGVNAAHLLGYLGRPTGEEVAAGTVTPGELLGRAGLELAYDDHLRGTPGRRTVTVDPRGVVTGEVESTEPVPGHDVVTHVDPAVQGRVEQVLADTVRASRAGGWPADSAAAVVLDVRTGGVVASASWPSYDPGVWTGGISAADYEALTGPGSGTPLLDRVVAGTFPPASTFKVVSLPAALRTGVDPDREYDCPGSVVIGDRRFTNYESEAYGPLSLERIIEVSCDTTFYRWAHEHWRRLGGVDETEDLRDPYVLLAQDFGFGRRTGIDLPGEATGLVPGREWKRAHWEATREEACARAGSGYPEERDRERREFLEQLARENCTDGWQHRAGDAANLAIGQGDLAATPLQVAVVYAAVANGGTLWEPHVAAEVRDHHGRLVETVGPRSRGELGLLPEELALLRRGLEGVNLRGTGAPAFAGFDLGRYPVAGKTGSAETFGRKSTAWYASYGPVDDPRYAVVIVVEQGGIGGEVAAPAARRIWELLAERDRHG
jgi:penicillin-binding protein 2